MTQPINPALPLVMRFAGFVDFVLAVVFIASPLLRGRIGDTLAYLVAAFLLLGSAACFFIAKRTDAKLAAATASPSTSATGA